MYDSIERVLNIFYYVSASKLSGRTGTEVDDTISIVNSKFAGKCKLREQKFDSERSREYDYFKFAGINIKNKGHNYLLN